MSTDEFRTDNGDEATDAVDELDRILTLIDNRCNDGTSRIKRENLKTVDSDGNEKLLIRYIEFDGDGNVSKETYCTENQLETLIEKTPLPVKSLTKDNTSAKRVSITAKAKRESVKIAPKNGKTVTTENKADGSLSSSRKEKADVFFKHFVCIIVPIATILTVMIIGQNYIKSRSDEKIRLLSIETVPINDEETTVKLCININTANSTELTFLPGIGEAKAKKIIEYREKNGRFESTEEILNVSGIGESTFENIKPYITVND